MSISEGNNMEENVKENMVKLSTDDIKQNIFALLLIFQECCIKHDLTFYLCGGTLLGAIRHKGFIPWDDDIDVCISRPEYNKLRELYKNEQIFPDYIRLICYEDGNFGYPFMKLLDTRTMVEKDYYDKDKSDCLWIDILPVDGLPADERELKAAYRKADKARKMLALSKAKKGAGRTKARKFIKYFASPFVRLMGENRYAQKIVDIASRYSYEASDYVGILTWGLYGPGERMNKQEFVKSEQVMFEGSVFSTMSCWKEYLSNLYGKDYMQLPPEEKRVTHDMVAWKKL